MSIQTAASQAAKVGDRVMIDSYEGLGGPATVVAIRPGESRCRVHLDNKSSIDFWAHDFEVTEILPSREGYDSRPDTIRHIGEVRKLLDKVIYDLSRRKVEHDLSKLQSPEVEVFDEMTPKLAGSTYGSEEYRSYLDAMKPALDHHYAANSHHPEHYPDGIRGMGLLDVVEMLCDWKAATLRHNDGDIRKSIEINQKRFGYSDELKAIFLNTLSLIEGDR